jgi:hypothetical protein
VFRVLAALCRLLDDITWPVEDIELVSLLLTVLEHTTNSKRLRAHFAPKAQLQRQLRLQEQQHHSQKQHAAGQQQQAEQKVHVAAAAPAPAGEPMHAAVTSVSPTPAAASSGSSHLHQQQQSSILSMTRPVILQEFAESAMTPGSATAFNASAAAAGPASPGQRPMGRKSNDLLRRTPSGNAIAGMAYTRLAPAASPPLSPAHTAASPAAGTHQLNPNPQQQQQQASSAAGGGSDTLASSAAAAAAMKAAADEHSSQGCVLDPAAQVVAQQPVAPVAAQSVLGSRKALRAVTAQQLLAEPVVQILLRKIG